MRIGIIGGGRVGSCLAGYFADAGLLEGITASSAEHSRQLAALYGLPVMTNLGLWQAADVLLIAVPDRLVAVVAADLAAKAGPAPKVVLHVSGSLGLKPLEPLQALGAHIGSLHPLQSFAGGKTQLAGVYMALDGDETAQASGKELVRLLGGHAFSVPAEERAAYHAAACICSNYAVTVQALAQQLMVRWTGDSESAWKALLPLFEGTSTNLRSAANPQIVLTGPIGRGDTQTVAQHLAVLPLNLQDVYRSLGLATTQLAEGNGTIDSSTAQALRCLLGGKYYETSNCSDH